MLVLKYTSFPCLDQRRWNIYSFDAKTCIHDVERYFHLGAVEVEVVVDDVVDGGVGLGVVVGEGRPDERKVGGEQVCWKSDIILRRGGGSVIIIITIGKKKVSGGSGLKRCDN